MDLDALTATIDQLRASGPVAFADAESIEALQRLHTRLESFVTESVAAFDAAGNWETDGARNAASWLVFRCQLPRGEARRQIRRGRDLRHLPIAADAWARGSINGADVDVMGSLRTEATEEVLARDERMLVEQAEGLRYDQFARAAAYWRQLADPDGADEDGERRRARRDVYLINSFEGMWFGKMNLDPIAGSIVSAELERIESLLFEADWAEARQRLGREPQVTDLARTPGQRRADALVEMATRSRTCPSDGRRPAPLYTVLVGWETLHGRICQLEDGTVVPPGSLLGGLGAADLERVVFSPGRRVEVGRTNRLFTGATRRAIEVRDQECSHPFCDVPAPSCQVDHIQPWAAGGPTTQENGRLLCGDHNRMRHQRPPPAAA
ncbi:MAG TPA: DUF222 domain-containing protein [Acidimicrobiales bacterium]|jgi:hypothetical protein|nr:DUF222 domain-containing protein [Acidimicrobiales bacterium]